MKNFLFHKIVYKTARTVLMPFIKCRFKLQFERVFPEKKPYIVLSNHTTIWDPLLVGMSFPEHMYFVASEHLFRHGFISKLLNLFLAPIMRVKARIETRTAINILRTLKAGCNVCMFAEGSCTWNGETCAITSATGKLIKHSGVTLVTYRLEGGYFTLPRWSKTIRPGKMQGYPVNEYTPDKLSEMTDVQIERAIREDLYVNAYTDNEKEPVKYLGKKLAENLETVLYMCPSCEKIGTIKSSRDTIKCKCGLSLRYNAYGCFESMTNKSAPFNTILEWDKWQNSCIQKNTSYYRSSFKNKPITTDSEQLLYQFEVGSSTKLIGIGNLYLYSDRLVLRDNLSGEESTFSLCDITDMSLMQQTILNFTVAGKFFYEIRTKHPRSGLKYLMLCNCLTDLRVMI